MVKFFKSSSNLRLPPPKVSRDEIFNRETVHSPLSALLETKKPSNPQQQQSPQKQRKKYTEWYIPKQYWGTPKIDIKSGQDLVESMKGTKNLDFAVLSRSAMLFRGEIYMEAYSWHANRSEEPTSEANAGH